MSSIISQSFHIALAAVEPCRDESRDEVARKRRPDDLRAEAENVHVVMLYALVRGIDVVADRRANPGKLAGGDRRSHAGAADEDPALGIASENGLADVTGLVRIVDPLGVRVGTQIDHRVPFEHVEHGVTQMDAPMVECDRHLHVWTVPHRRQRTRCAS